MQAAHLPLAHKLHALLTYAPQLLTIDIINNTVVVIVNTIVWDLPCVHPQVEPQIWVVDF
jgi:hypothetical protein